MSSDLELISARQLSSSICVSSTNSNNVSQSTFVWRDGSSPREPNVEVTLKSFSTLLLKAEILDNNTIPLQGASIWLPYGMKLRALFDGIVSSKYQQFGLDEFFYPSLVPESVFSPLDGLYSLEGKVLHAGVPEELRDGVHRGLLSPTGEATIYTHWAKYVRHAGLPIRMYRNAAYFRPVSHQAGMGIFNSMEATGVFEFHAAYADREQVAREILVYHEMLQEILTHFSVPRIWTLRPPWTNNGAISRATFGCDTLLPNRTSLQVAAIYNQDTIFSERFKIFTATGNRKECAKQLAGFCSRRLLMSSLLISCSIHGKMFIPPRYSPIQIAIVYRTRMCKSLSETIVACSKVYPEIRFASFRVDSSAEFDRVIRKLDAKGVPLIVMVFDKRTINDKSRIVFKRGDDGRELSIQTDNPEDLVAKVGVELLAGLTCDVDNRYDAYFRAQFIAADKQSLEDLQVNRTAVNMLPLLFDEQAVMAIERAVKGEIIGFLDCQDERECAVTKKTTTKKAVICRRF